MVPKSPLVALAPWCPAAPYPVSPRAALSSRPLPTPALLFAGEASRYTFLTPTFLTNSTLQTCQGRNTRGSDFTLTSRGVQNPTLPWRGQGEQGTHVINIKSYLLQMEDIYCTSLTHIHKNTIYTERLGRMGALQGGSRSPPAALTLRGAAPMAHQSVSSQRCASCRPRGWGNPHRAHHTASYLEKGKEEGEERAGVSSSLVNPQGLRNEAGP